MAVHMKIGKTAYDKLPDALKAEYKQQGDDYVLDLDGYEDPDALKRARDHEKENAAQAKRDLAAEKTRADKAERKAADLEGAGKSVDDAVKAKDTEWQTKYDADLAAANAKFDGLKNTVVNNTKTQLATGIANKISTSPTLLTDKLAARIDVEVDEKTHEIKTFIIGSDGKRSAGTLDDLEKDALKNKEWAPILRGTKATGGGGAPPSPGGGSAPRSNAPHRPGTPTDDLTKLSGSEMAARIREQKEAEGRA